MTDPHRQPKELRAEIAELRRRLAEAEAARTAAEARYTAITKALPDLLIRFNKEGTIIDCRARNEDEMFVPPAALIGRKLADVMPPEFLDQTERFSRQLDAVLESGRVLSFEYFVPIPERELYYEAHLLAISRDEALIIARNISERKWAEAALRQSEAKTRALLAAIPDVMLRISRDGRYLECLPSAEFPMAFPAERVVGRQIDDLLPPAVAEQHLYYLSRALDSGEPQVFDFQLIVDERWHSFEAHMVASGPDEVVAIMRDITARKQSELELKRRARQQAAVAELARVALPDNARQRLLQEAADQVARTLERVFCQVLVLSPDGQALVVNAAAGQRARFDQVAQLPAESGTLGGFVLDAGGPIISRLAAESRFEPLEALARLGVAALLGVAIEGRERPFGALLAYSDDPDAFNDDDLNFLQTIAHVLAEAVERWRMEEVLRETQKMESLGALAGGVAHDFNNLLVAMLGQSSVALARLPADSPARNHIIKAVRAAERAADLTRQMLAYSGRGQFEVRPVDLNQLIKENYHLFAVALPSSVQLRHETDPALPLIEADAGQIQQVVMNLILNGVEAIGERPGTLYLATGQRLVKATDDKFWRFTGQPLEPGLYVVLEIADDGPGIEPKMLPRIFDPFFTTKFTGRGLGLAAVLGIIRGHRGGLFVESRVGAGTRFELLFPVAAPKAAPAPELPPGGASCILVIDDETAVLDAVRDILERVGLGILTANSGEEGVELFRQRLAEVDLVLLDLTMTGMDGEETFAALQAVSDQVPVLLTSGYHETEAMLRFAGRGLAGFVQKPYRAEALVAQVRHHLRQANARTAADPPESSDAEELAST